MHGQNEESDDGDDDFAYGEFDARRVISNSTIFNHHNIQEISLKFF